ncbi:MAG TPA: hypothetical protein P5121_04535, partial [Caldilineaceae bacterium]|nr:hypothetical protein [Caldilineaceae bacterium]
QDLKYTATTYSIGVYDHVRSCTTSDIENLAALFSLIHQEIKCDVPGTGFLAQVSSKSEQKLSRQINRLLPREKLY